MDEKTKVCKNCNANNDADALFCGCCGQKFDEFNKGAVLNGESVLQNNQVENGFRTDGISEYEFYAYIGKNHDKFMPSFRKFFTGKKASFSPLVFILSFLFSPLAGCFWFLHRKMYKIGSLFLAISLALTIAGGSLAFAMVGEIKDTLKSAGVLPQSSVSLDNSKLSPVNNGYIEEFTYNYDDDDYDDYDDYYEDDYNDDFYDSEYDNDYNDDYDYDFGYDYDYNDDFDNDYDFDNSFGDFDEQLFEKQISKVSAKYYLFELPLILCQIALVVLMSIFAKYWYFKDAAEKITKIKQANPSPSSINQIAAAGGTSCVAWVITLILVVIASFAYSFALVVYLLKDLMVLFM